MAKKEQTTAKASLESNVERLEKIVVDLEDGDVNLEKSISLYEEGTKLGRDCLEKLESMEQKVNLIREGQNGELEQTPFDSEGSS